MTALPLRDQDAIGLPNQRQYQLVQANPNNPMGKIPWFIDKDPVGTKYKVSVVVTFKKTGEQPLAYSTPYFDLEVKAGM